VAPVAFDGQGRQAVAGPSGWAAGVKDPALRVLRVWDLPSGRERIYSIAHLMGADWWGYDSLAFAPDGSLFGAGRGGVRRLFLPPESRRTVSSETVYTAGKARLDLSRDGRVLLALGARGRGVSRLWLAALDPTGRVIVTSDVDRPGRAPPARVLRSASDQVVAGHALRMALGSRETELPASEPDAVAVVVDIRDFGARVENPAIAVTPPFDHLEAQERRRRGVAHHARGQDDANRSRHRGRGHGRHRRR